MIIEPREMANKLRRAFEQETGTKNRHISFPSKYEVALIDKNTLRLHSPLPGPFQNMQHDENAIDAWALVLNRWLNYKIEISIAMPSGKETPAQLRHFNRLVYRLARLRQLPSLSFSESLKERFSQAPFVSYSKSLFVNFGDSDLRNSRQYPPILSSENDLELFFFHNPNFLKSLTSFQSVHRQLPVGLFQDQVAKGNNLFPAKKSAIDLILKSENNVSVIELKKPNNRGVGHLSELLFYCYFVEDISLGRIMETGSNPLIPEKSIIKGCFLLGNGSKHPLLDSILLKTAGENLLRSKNPITTYYYEFNNGSKSCQMTQESV